MELLMHYNDLKADLDGEMRRLAAFLNVSVPEVLWPAVVQRCTFESMKARGEEIGPFEFVFEGGTNSFLFKGTNGRWRDVLTQHDLSYYQQRVSAVLPSGAADWLANGSLATNRRP